MDDVDNNININIQVPDNVRFILDTIRDAGYEAYIVGGCVRDRLLGREPEDWDITTSALPEQVKRLFSNTVDTGIRHGTVMVIRGGVGYEVTTYRVDGKYKDGRHPESVLFTPNLEEDLKRRDFTINAFAYDPVKGIVDLFDGISDLKKGMVRAVGDPENRFDEDALRIMRAVRFAAQLSFDMDLQTKNAISKFGPKLAMVSAERIRVEFEKTLYSDNPADVNNYRRLGLAEYIVPKIWERCFLYGSEKIYANIPEAKDEKGKVLRLAAFFKEVTSEECARAMRAMTFDNRTRDLVCAILKYRGGSAETQGGFGITEEKQKIKGELREVGAEVYRIIIDYNEACGINADEQRAVLEEIEQNGEAFCLKMLAVTGADLIANGIPQGLRIGETLNMLLDKVIEDPQLNNKETLLKLI